MDQQPSDGPHAPLDDQAVALPRLERSAALLTAAPNLWTVCDTNGVQYSCSHNLMTGELARTRDVVGLESITWEGDCDPCHRGSARPTTVILG